RRHQGDGAAVLRRPPGRGRRDSRPAHRRRSERECGPHAGANSRRPVVRAAPHRPAARARSDTAEMIRVDAHHHVWTIARGDYRWLSSDMSIARDYRLDDLRPLLGDITGTVLVQAADTEAETAFMLDVARGSEGLVRGVVGWTDLASPDSPAR